MSEKPPRSLPSSPQLGAPRPRPVMPGPGRNRMNTGLKPPEHEVTATGMQALASTGVRPPFWKRKYLVYPKFQMTLIFLNSLVTVIMFGFVAFQVVSSHVYLENLVRSTRLPAQNLFTQMLSLQLRNLLINLAIALGLSLFLTGFTTLIMSHRLAGPMLRLKNYFRDVSKTGNFPETINFRKGDFFQDLPPLINQAFASMKKKWFR